MSALTEAQAKLQSQSSMAGAASTMVRGLISSALSQARQMIEKSRKSPVKATRASKNAYPVRGFENGRLLYSDGTVRYSPDDEKLQILRQNVLDQTNYTPEAQKTINAMQLNSSIVNNGMDGGAYAGGMQITYPSKNIIEGAPWTTEAFRHEALHNLDNNIYTTSDIRSPNSIGFSDKLRKSNPAEYNKIKKTMGEFPKLYQNAQHVNDVESFAYYGMNPGQSTGNESYSKVYAPQSRMPVRYSPRFPTSETQAYIDEFENRFMKKRGWTKSTSIGGE